MSLIRITPRCWQVSAEQNRIAQGDPCEDQNEVKDSLTGAVVAFIYLGHARVLRLACRISGLEAVVIRLVGHGAVIDMKCAPLESKDERRS